MTYELAKELKDAGFPQYEDFVMAAEDVTHHTAMNRRDHRTFDLSIYGYPETEPDYYDQGKWRASCIFSRQYLASEIGKKETLYFPTLSELIAACGEQFVGLDRQDGGWKAIGYVSELGLSGHEGKTPEEAVARLYLALNKKP